LEWIMGKISLERARAGMILKKRLSDKSGKVLLDAGTQLTGKMLRRLKKSGINEIVVEEEKAVEDQAAEKTAPDQDKLEKARKKIIEELDHRFEGFEQDSTMTAIKEAALQHLSSRISENEE